MNDNERLKTELWKLATELRSECEVPAKDGVMLCLSMSMALRHLLQNHLRKKKKGRKAK